MIDISIIDLVMINCISYLVGRGTGVVICIKNKDKLLIIKSRSRDNLSSEMNNPIIQNQPQQVVHTTPVFASTPPPMNPLRITDE